MDEDRFNMSVRKFLKQVGVTSQRVIEEAVRSGAVKGDVLKVRMTLTAENAPIEHVIEDEIAVRQLERDDFSSSRHPALALCLSMIFSENR